MLRLLIIAGAFLFITSCKNKGGDNRPADAIDPSVVNNPITASSEKVVEKDAYPLLKFESETHNFGTIVEGEKVAFAYRFKNVGKAPLVIRSAQGSCGCTVPEFPKDPVPPGGEGVVNVTFDSEGKTGHQEKTVTIISNTMPNTVTLYVIGDVTAKQ